MGRQVLLVFRKLDLGNRTPHGWPPKPNHEIQQQGAAVVLEPHPESGAARGWVLVPGKWVQAWRPQGTTVPPRTSGPRAVAPAVDEDVGSVRSGPPTQSIFAVEDSGSCHSLSPAASGGGALPAPVPATRHARAWPAWALRAALDAGRALAVDQRYKPGESAFVEALALAAGPSSSGLLVWRPLRSSACACCAWPKWAAVSPQTGGISCTAHRTFSQLARFEVGWLDWISTVAGAAAASNCPARCLSGLAGRLQWRVAARRIIAAVLVLGAVDAPACATRPSSQCLRRPASWLPLVLFVGVGLFSSARNFSFAPVPDYGPFSRTALLLLFAFGGFGSAVVRTEMRDPRRSVPFALLVAIGVVAFLYVLIQVVLIGTLPGLAESRRPVADAAGRFLGSVGGAVVAVAAVISVLRVLHALMLATPRPLRDGATGEGAARSRRDPSTLPHAACRIVVSAAVILALAVSGLSSTPPLKNQPVSRLLILATRRPTLPVLRLTGRERPAQFVVRGGWFVSAAALALCVWLLSNSPWREARDVGIAAAIGLLVFLPYRPASR